MSPTPLDQHREANASEAAVSEIVRTIETSGVEFIYYQGISITGRVMGKVVPAKHLRRNLERGINLHRTAISDLQADRAGNLIGGGVQAPEFTAMADLDTFAVLPWDTSVARFFTEIYEPEHLPEIGGQRLGTDSRGTLKRVHADFTAKTGLELRSGCEPEMTWKGPGMAVRFAAGASPSYHIDNLELMRPVYQRVIRYATALGLNMIEGDYEDPGQLELNWMFDKADLTADRLITYRQICRQVARELDLIASFMPKPATGMMGNGCHHNISFWRGDQNVLAEPGRRELHLTQEGQHLLGGILSHTPGSMMINGQTINSYKRYWDAGQFAPSEINWGMDNRSCTVRLSANGRLECRLPDASVNPYLSHAAILGAAADGLANAIDPGPSHIGASEVGAAGRFEPLPLTLAEAISAFQRDSVIQETLGQQMSQILIDYKTDEWARFCSAVTDYEQTRYEQAIP